jgi:CSLREA domain-containing protein
MKPTIFKWFFVTMVWLFFAVRVMAATYTVTKTADTNDGTCDADCSLREAVVAANASVGADTIDFNIPGSDPGFASGYYTITVASTLTLSDAAGVFIDGYSQAGATRNTAAFGETVNANLLIRVAGAPNPIFTINSNANHLAGLNINSSSARTVDITGSGNWIEGNFMGSNITGLDGSSGWGTVRVVEGNNNIIGTNGDGVGDAGERNVLMGSSSQFMISIGSTTPVGNVVAGNYVGTDKTGRTCSAGTRTRAEIQVSNATNNRIGTNYDGVSDSEEANIFACINSDARGEVRFFTGVGGVLQGNYIGTNPHGDNLSSFSVYGIVFRDTATNFGGTIKGNTIAYNAGGGIEFLLSVYRGNKITNNIIHDNGPIEIDLGNNGVTANDEGDVDTIGGNNGMNYPVINSAEYVGGGYYKLAGILDSNASEAPFNIEICTASNSPSGHGGCLQTLKEISVNDYRWEANVYVGDEGNNSHTFSALATNVNNDTSEFSTNFTYNPPSQSSSNNSENTNSGPPSCGDRVPSKEPDLFQVTAGAGSAIVYFSPVRESNYYFISYGLGNDAESYGVVYPTPYEDGVIFYQVNNLDPKTKYFFKVRAGNGCATGAWSRVLSVKTDAKKSRGGFIYYAYSKVIKKISGFKDLIKKI